MTKVLYHLATILVIASVAFRSAGSQAASLWSAESGPFRIEWSRSDITVRRADGPMVFSAADFARASFAMARRDMLARNLELVFVQQRLWVVSLAGPLLTLKDETYLDYQPSAHGSGGQRYWTFDLRKQGPFGLDPEVPFRVADSGPRRLVDLRMLFAASDLHRAMMADAFVRQAVDVPTASLNELLNLLADGAASVPGHCVFIATDLLTRFAITAVATSGILVRIEVSGPDICRDNRTELELRLPYRGPITTMIRPDSRDLHIPPPGLPGVELSYRASRGGLR